ncbi:MAG TPA: SAF domain-containing protein [Acidimicrobiales bacterium]
MSPSPTVLTVRARRALARPAPRRLGVAALAVATGLTVTSLVGAAGAARDRWGDTRPVVVATRDLAPGEVLDGGATEIRDLPAAVLGETALAEAPAGAVVRHPILAGEPVVAARLAPTGLVGAAALVPAGERAVAVPAGPGRRPLWWWATGWTCWPCCPPRPHLRPATGPAGRVGPAAPTRRSRWSMGPRWST